MLIIVAFARFVSAFEGVRRTKSPRRVSTFPQGKFRNKFVRTYDRKQLWERGSMCAAGSERSGLHIENQDGGLTNLHADLAC